MNTPLIFKKNPEGLYPLVQVYELAVSLGERYKWKKPYEWLRGVSGKLFIASTDDSSFSRKSGIVAGTDRALMAYAHWIGPEVSQQVQERLEMMGLETATHNAGISFDKRISKRTAKGTEKVHRGQKPAIVHAQHAAQVPAQPSEKPLDVIASFVMQAATLAARVKGADGGEVARESLKLMQELSGIEVYDRFKKTWAPKPDMSEMPKIRDADEVPSLTATELAKDYGMTARELNSLLLERGVIIRNGKNEPELKKEWSHIGMMVPFTGGNNHTGFRLLYNRLAHGVIKLLVSHPPVAVTESSVEASHAH